jgi:aldehyde:ferredoxin oxidoreductase
MINWLRMTVRWDVSLSEFMETGERIYNPKRMYNARSGISRKDDTLPHRFLTLKRGKGKAAENLPPLGDLLNQYYSYRNWDELRHTDKKKDEES